MEQYLELVRAARTGDAGAFAGLYEKIYQDLYRFALYTLRNESDAEDYAREKGQNGTGTECPKGTKWNRH